MTIFSFDLAIFLTSLFAGLVGSLTGLGGAVILVPVLVMGFHTDIHYAAGASLVSVIATSSAAAVAYVRDGYSNVRIAMFLEIATTCGALAGAYLAGSLDGSMVSCIFGLVLIYSAVSCIMPAKTSRDPQAQFSGLSRYLDLSGSYREDEQKVYTYAARRPLSGFAMMALAGGLSGLLGIGSGAMKVLAMDKIMGLPIKVSTTTSNFMIGVTACASAGIYLKRGYVDPVLSMPVVLGVVLGSFLGARILPKTNSKRLRAIFAAVMFVVAAEMIYKGLTGEI
jgi:uncharacterized protein